MKRLNLVDVLVWVDITVSGDCNQHLMQCIVVRAVSANSRTLAIVQQSSNFTTNSTFSLSHKRQVSR
jgi:hypothetical protein